MMNEGQEERKRNIQEAGMSDDFPVGIVKEGRG
jgi:hypothetical protein